ncbi:MAG: hypothetical protein U0T84_07505 [Chitinophagales bacterium]
MARAFKIRWCLAGWLITGFALAQQPDSCVHSTVLRRKPSSLIITNADKSRYKLDATLPRGAVICRMEDAIQKKTKVKVDVGVGNP